MVTHQSKNFLINYYESIMDTKTWTFFTEITIQLKLFKVCQVSREGLTINHVYFY